MFTSSNLLIPALIFAAVGFLAGVLIMTLVGDRRRRKEEAEKSSPVMDDLIVPEMPALPETRFESIANLYRESRSGKLVTDVKGKVYLNRGSIPDEQLRSLQEAARNWQTWLGVPTLTPPAPPSIVAPSVEVAPTIPAPLVQETSPVSLPQEEEEMPVVGTETLMDESDLPVSPEDSAAEMVSDQMEAVETELINSEPTNTAVLPPIPPPPAVRFTPVEKPRSKTMVGQIDDVLQEMLPETIYAGHNIHLSEEYSNGVVVWVGANKYIGIESVPDPEIKALIQSAVRKWEATEGQL